MGPRQAFLAAREGKPVAPVLADEADPQVAGDVGRGLDAHHARKCLGRGDVHAEDVRAGMLGEFERRVRHAGQRDVVDVMVVAQREVVPL